MRIQQKRISDKKLALIISGVFSAIVVVAVVAAIIVRNASMFVDGSSISSVPKNEDSSIASTESEITSSDSIVYESDEGTTFNVPDELRAVYLKPGQNFLLKTTDGAETIKSQIDAALNATVKLKFNSVVIFTKTTYGVIFNDSTLKSVSADFDILEYALEAAKKQNLYTYVVYPVLAYQTEDKLTEVSDLSEQTINNAVARAEAFAKKYSPSAIVFDEYSVQDTESMNSFVLENAYGRDKGDFLRAQVNELIRLSRNAVRQNNKVSQIGFLASSVWANSTTNQKGSETSLDYESFVDGFADTRDFVLNQKFSFVMVENLLPTDSTKANFKTVAQWWTTLCSQADIAFYNVHASSKLLAAAGEFSSPDQLIRQVSILKELKTYSGSVFDSLSALSADKEGSTTLLLKFFDNQIKDNLVFSKLKMSSPSSNNITTYDSTIIFAGATDPNFKTTFNGQTIDVTEKGYFSYDAALKIGTNTFKISHKGQTVTYTVVRKVKLLESVAPTGTVEVDGGTNITISVKAFSGSTVTAKINGTTFKLEEQQKDDVTDDTSASNYAMFVGEYKAPAAIEVEQNLGKIYVSASWQGYSENMSGAIIKVYAKPAPILPPEPTPTPENSSSNSSSTTTPTGPVIPAVQITEKYAETFPTDKLNDQSQPDCYPLPAGTVDFIVGNELVYNDGSNTYKYYKLMSGHRVYSKDTKSLGKIEMKNNKISSVKLDYDGRYLNLVVDNSWNVPFKYLESPISYSKDYEMNGDYKITTVTYRIFYTDQIDLTKVVMEENPLVTKVECVLNKVEVNSVQIPVCDIVLTLRTTGGFFGAIPSYLDNDNSLNIKLNVPAPIQKAENAYGYTLKGAVIVVDAGHNKTRPGALGSLRDSVTGEYLYPEYVMNDMIRQKVVPILKNLGATVITIDNERMLYAEERLEYFRTVNPHLMICIHHNSTNSSYARGAVGTYFNSYSQLLCKSIMTSIAGNYINNDSNRSRDYYFGRLQMTRDQLHPSLLIECGFISNPTEHEQLIKEENQQKIADQLVKGLINYFVKTGSLVYDKIDFSNSINNKIDFNEKPDDSTENTSSSVSSGENISSSITSKEESYVSSNIVKDEGSSSSTASKEESVSSSVASKEDSASSSIASKEDSASSSIASKEDSASSSLASKEDNTSSSLARKENFSLNTSNVTSKDS